MIDLELSNAPLRDWLKQETREAHDRTDAAFGALMERGERGFAQFLTAHAMAAPGLAQRIRNQPSLPFAADFSPAVVTALLKRDLDALNAPFPGRFPLAGFETAEECAGAAYTLAGSRLGAKAIRRQWGAAFRSAYLDHESLFGDWRRFCGLLNTLGETSHNRDKILSGALAAFARFEAACRRAVPA